MPFVTTAGRNFMLDGQPFRHVGANMPELVYNTRKEIVTNLDGAKRCGLKQIRVFLPNNKVQFATIIDRLGFVLDQALERDIHITVALAHNYFQPVWAAEGNNGLHVVEGDETFYTRVFGPLRNPLHMLNDSWIQGGYKKNYIHFAFAVAKHFKDHEGIFAWDIANEVNVSNTGNVVLIAQELDFYHVMAAKLKDADPNHMVATGLISTHWAGLMTTKLKNQLYMDPNIDYVSVHEYNDFHDDQSNHQKDDIIRANLIWKKPVIIEEFGMAAHLFQPDVFDAVDNYYERMFDGGALGRVDAILQWTASFNADDDGNQDSVFSPQAQDKVQAYEDLWEQFATRFASRSLLINAGG